MLAEKRSPTSDEMMSVAWLTLAAGAVKAPPKPAPYRHAAPVALFASSVLIIGVLAFEHPASTEVALTATASNVGMTLQGQQVLLRSLDLVQIDVDGCEAMSVPDRSGSGSRPVRDEALKLQVPAGDPQPGTLTLSEIVAPAGARVVIEHGRSARRVTLAILAKTLGLQVVGAGTVNMALIAEQNAPLALAGTRVIDLQCEARDWIRLAMTARERSVELRAPLDVSSLAFEDVDEHIDADRTVVSRRSTLESGQLTLRSINGETRSLERGALLKFARAQGEVRRLAAADSALALEFAGDVEGMETGSLKNPVSLMPSRLQWLRARKTVELTYGAALYLFGVALALYRWMQMP